MWKQAKDTEGRRKVSGDSFISILRRPRTFQNGSSHDSQCQMHPIVEQHFIVLPRETMFHDGERGTSILSKKL
jgi:hypothetical protein